MCATSGRKRSGGKLVQRWVWGPGGVLQRGAGQPLKALAFALDEMGRVVSGELVLSDLREALCLRSTGGKKRLTARGRDSGSHCHGLGTEAGG